MPPFDYEFSGWQAMVPVTYDAALTETDWQADGRGAMRCDPYANRSPASMDSYPIDQIRAQFPALALTDEGRPRIYFDNPAGTQVPLRVIERTVEALKEKNANLGGYFSTTVKIG